MDYVGKLVLVKEWFRTKQIYDEGINHFPQFGEVTKETAKAVLLNNRYWTPKACVDLAEGIM